MRGCGQTGDAQIDLFKIFPHTTHTQERSSQQGDPDEQKDENQLETKVQSPAEGPAAASVEVPGEREAAVSFPIVGIGASAGGLAAIQAFFAAMPPDTESGMAFVLVQHLAPDHRASCST